MAVTLDPAIRKAISEAMFTVPAADRIEAKSALEIKPGWYRTRDGGRIEVVSEAAAHIAAAGYAWEVRRESGDVFGVTAEGRYWSKWLKPEMPDDAADLIERIEDEPKAEDKCQPKFPFRFVVSGMDAASVGNDQTCVVTAASGRKNLVDETLKEFTAEVLSLGWRAKVAELEAKIARLEAENESLSRQLRSRALNSEPVTTGKKWRWSPMV